MIDEAKDPHSADGMPPNAALHSESPAASADTSNHKWVEPEHIARDLGFQRALTDWIITHRSKWCHARRPKSQQNGISMP
jgi:hypothetical protein